MSEEEEFEFRLRYENEQADKTAVDTMPESAPVQREPIDVGKSIFPTAGEIPNEGIGKPLRIAAGVGDALQLPTRALAFITGQGDMTDPEANIWAKPREAYRNYFEALKQSTPDSANAKMIIPNYMGGSSVSANVPQKNVYDAAKMLGEQVISAAGDPTIASAMLGKLIKYPAGAISGLSKFGRKQLGERVEELSHISEETLRAYGTGFSKSAKEIRAAAGKQYEVGQDLVKKINNWDIYNPLETKIKNALDNMGETSSSRLINTLEQAKKDIPYQRVNKGAIENIDKLIESIEEEVGETITASALRQQRINLDKIIGDSGWGKQSDFYIDAVKKARKEIKNQLNELAVATKNPEYITTMNKYHKQLETVKKLKRSLGKDLDTQADRAEGYVSNLMNNNKTQKRQILQDLDELLGTDYSNQVKRVSQSKEISPVGFPERGKPGIKPRTSTGAFAAGWLAGGQGIPALAAAELEILDVIGSAIKGGLNLPVVKGTAKVLGVVSGNVAEANLIANAIQKMNKQQKESLKTEVNQYLSAKNPEVKKLFERSINKKFSGGK